MLGIKPLRDISIDIDRQAARNTADVYPGAIALDHIKYVTRAALHQSISGVECALCSCVGGSACQGLSGVNATAQGCADPRTQLFFEMLRVYKDVFAEKLRLQFCTENVATMKDDDRNTFSKGFSIRKG